MYCTVLLLDSCATFVVYFCHVTHSPCCCQRCVRCSPCGFLEFLKSKSPWIAWLTLLIQYLVSNGFLQGGSLLLGFSVALKPSLLDGGCRALATSRPKELVACGHIWYSRPLWRLCPLCCPVGKILQNCMHLFSIPLNSMPFVCSLSLGMFTTTLCTLLCIFHLDFQWKESMKELTYHLIGLTSVCRNIVNFLDNILRGHHPPVSGSLSERLLSFKKAN